MNPATNVNGDVEAARRLIGDAEALGERGWRLASPVWFPQIVTALAVLASVPVALLLDQDNGAGWYWTVMTPVAAVASGWFFASRGVRAPDRVGLVVLATGVAMLIGSLLVVRLAAGSWDMAPWLILGMGFAVFAAAWRSVSTAVIALAVLGAVVAVTLTDAADSYLVLALVVGVVAGGAAVVELVRADPARAR
ncbi:hypothetical protein [Blastococcus haudaquaticus]|uniref:Uncharacterized protein n=1 Tax=Blastococcus haudaquaticus TaxID=1938745 RepID=A0A286H524_9ACTN|nr:hypothetical protein [Blastococcus haudaquaticus]SOE02900.1 hypothetical protein SAMN06272739_3860 [Blastococcus haudaquaticus]